MHIEIRDHFVYAPNQWETTLHCTVVSHWLGAYTKWSLRNWYIITRCLLKVISITSMITDFFIQITIFAYMSTILYCSSPMSWFVYPVWWDMMGYCWPVTDGQWYDESAMMAWDVHCLAIWDMAVILYEITLYQRPYFTSTSVLLLLGDVQWLNAYSAPNHHLKQCWVIVNWILRNKLQWNFN